MTELKAHPAAELFPLMEGEDFSALLHDIKAHGQRDAIVVLGHEILDGRNRYRACQQLHIKPRLEEWDEQGDPIEYVVSKNLHRRHLSASQRAMIAARIANIEVGQVGGGHGRTGTEISVPDAARLLNVHHTTVTSARKVLREGTPEEIAKVSSGELAASTIAKQIRKDSSPVRRAKRQTESLATTGRNPERIQRQQLNAEIWGRIRDALIHLTSLPLVTDVVAIARAHDKTGLVDQRVEPAMKWLKEFADVWSTERSEAEGSQGHSNGGDSAHPGNGRRAA